VAQINLLKQTSVSSSNLGNTLPKILVWVFAGLVVAVLIYYAWLFIDANGINKKIKDAQDAMVKYNTEIANVPRKDELYTRQLQLKNYNELVGKHVYWSQLFPALAKSTLKSATYSNLQLQDSGNTLSLSANVPTVADLDKYLQVFDIPEFNKNFSNVRVTGFNKSSDLNSTSIKFQLKMQYDPSLLQYDPSLNPNGN